MALLGDKILSGESVFVIYGSKRSLDYFPFPEIVQLLEKKESGVLILVATREQKLKLRELICKELREKGSSNFLERKLLIETPAQLQDQLQTGPNQIPLNINSFGSLVFHELDKLVEYNDATFEELKQELFSALSHPQLIVTTGCWNRNLLGGLLERSNQNFVILKDALEAAVYSDLAMTIEWANDSAEKVQLLHSYLESFRPAQYRTLIYAANANELANKMPNIRTLEHQGRASKNAIKNWQEETKGQVLVLEKHSPELKLDQIESNVHFDMPKTWNQFRERFGVFKEDPPLQSLVVLDKETRHFLPHLVEFQQRHGGVISEKIAAEHVQLRQDREISSASRQCVICPVLLLYGRCRTLTCQYRHLLGEVDRSVLSTVPKEGRIQFKVLKICTPTHFASRLLTLKADESTVCVKYPQKEVQELLEKHYSKPENIEELREPLLQDICAYKCSDGRFERVSITFLPHNSRDSDIRVKNLDSNTAIYHVKPQELVQLPEDLKNLPPTALDIRLVGCIPFNGEETWQSLDLQTVGEFIKEGDVCEATICFSLSHTIFVEQLVVKQGSYRDLLERKKLSRYDNEICNCLKKLCNE
ncbi:putative ATP-dependent RNA helicase BoYb [Drosophila bipectinata]|uniref:putative ATP-dependent RNA helicase BoYb n=1 Tax=Drosophila bipectinata TaxID=42026 RepID=UPI0038B26977